MILGIDPPHPVVLSGDLGAPGDLDGRSVVLEVAGREETGVLCVDGPRPLRLWFDRGRPVYGSAEGLVGLDGRLEQDLPAERFAAAEKRAETGGGLAHELAEVGVAPERLREELRSLVLDVLRILVGLQGHYEFIVRPHPYTGLAWVDLAQAEPSDPPRRPTVRPAVPVATPRARRVDVPIVALSMPEGVLGLRLDPTQWLVALALADPRSEREVVERTGLTDRAVAAAVEHLRRAGVVADALTGLSDPPSAAPRHPITGRQARTTLVLPEDDT